MGRLHADPARQLERRLVVERQSEPVQDGGHPAAVLGSAVPDHAGSRNRIRSGIRSRAGRPSRRGRLRTGITTTTPCRTSTTAARRSTATGWRTATARSASTSQVFGPYTLPGKLHEYGIPDGSFNAPAARYCPQGDSCNKSLRTDGGAAVAGRHRLRLGVVRLRQRLLRHRRSRRVVDLAGVRRDALRGPRRHPGRVRAAAQPRRQRAAERRRQPDAELGRHALRRLDVLEGGRQPLAERTGRHLDAGRELRPLRLRARVQPPARAARQLQQSVRSTTSGTSRATGR